MFGGFIMMCEARTCGIWFITYLTRVWLLACVFSYVIIQVSLNCKRFITYITRKWFFTSMASFVNSQVTINHKCFITYITCKGLLSECSFLWTTKFLLSLNAFSQMSQEYGFSPVWILLWIINCEFFANSLLHTSQVIILVFAFWIFSGILWVII